MNSVAAKINTETPMNVSAQPSSPDPGPVAALLYHSAVRMADEGIPVLAIARSLQVPSEEIFEALKDAVARGSITELPRADWPPGTRSSRAAVAAALTEQQLKTIAIRHLKASPLEAGMLALLLRRDEVTKEQLHGVIEENRDPGKEPTEIKMVDVIICKLRKKIVPLDAKITTMWGTGYYIERKTREAIVARFRALQED